MPFQCPECKKTSLGIKAQIELPPDSRSDEISLQIVTCSSCGFSGIAVYEESRRGALDADSYSHIGYRVRKEDQVKLRNMIRKCPTPREQRCTCPAHRELGKTDSAHRWIGLRELQVTGQFELRL
jgi:hypothetical protein